MWVNIKGTVYPIYLFFFSNYDIFGHFGPLNTDPKNFLAFFSKNIRHTHYFGTKFFQIG